MVLPIQQNMGVRGDPDAEITFGLQDRDVEVTWIMPAEIEERMSRSPGVRVATRGLPVGQFLTAEVRRVGDPLLGELRRLAALVHADTVLLPVQASLEAEPGADPTVHFWTAIIEARTGRVLWLEVLDGEVRPATDPRGLASAVDRLARSILWYAGA
jgi:hypothetical protein